MLNIVVYDALSSSLVVLNSSILDLQLSTVAIVESEPIVFEPIELRIY